MSPVLTRVSSGQGFSSVATYKRSFIARSRQSVATPGRSLRFESADSAYLSRTPGSAGNRQTWTWSGWVKRSKLGASQYIFESRTGASDTTIMNLSFNASDQLQVVNYSYFPLISTAVFRDVSAWYHIVWSLDTTQATASDRMKLYVNGTEITTFGTDNRSSLTQNSNQAINQAAAHYIGGQNYLDGYIALVHLIDGQQLTPSSFGETSATTGQWIAKTYSGTYGTNGFFLDFLDKSNNTASTLGKDSSGNNNNFTPNNFIVSASSSTGYSVYFDGAGDRITANDSQLALGSGDWTVECYIKIATGADGQEALVGYTGNNPEFEYDNTFQPRWMTDATYAPGLSQNVWTHLAWTRSGSTGRIFVDGVLRATIANATTNYTATALAIGARVDGSTEFKGWISNLRIVVGTALYTADFTRPVVPLSAVSGTKLLTCQSSTIVDNSGNNISLTTVGNTTVTTDIPSVSIDASNIDSLRDHPTSAGTSTGAGDEVSGNYCTFNPLTTLGGNSGQSSAVLSKGNLRSTNPASNSWNVEVGTIALKSGKWYYEYVVGGTVSNFLGGWADPREVNYNDAVGNTSRSYGYYSTGNARNSNSNTAFGNSYTAGDVIGCAIDIDNLKIYWSKNGVWQNSANPAAGTGSIYTIQNPVTNNFFYTIAVSTYDSSQYVDINTGQRPFTYTAPAGFSPIVDTLLTAPTIALPNQYVGIVTYTGNGTSQSISGLNFSPDFVWLKSRGDGTDHNHLFDTIRGAGVRIFSNLANAESTDIQTLSAFNSDGFSVGSQTAVNQSGEAMVGWTWDAASSNTTNNNGSIQSTVRANTTAGFSIVTWSGTTANATVGHGLNAAPQFILFKTRGNAYNWRVYHESLGNTQALGLNLETAAATNSSYFNNTSPTSTVINLGTSDETNDTSMIAYCWTSVPGYSAFGSYVGNASRTVGPFVYTGFRPAWIMFRNTGASQYWGIYDNKRNTYNAATNYLQAQSSSAEGTSSDDVVDFLSNGFKIRSAFGFNNGNGATMIYAAFAESPFQYSRAR